MDSPTEQAPLTHVFVFYGLAIGVPLVMAALVVGIVLNAAISFPVGLIVLLVVAAIAGAVFLTYRRYDSVDEILLDELDVVDGDETDHARAYNLLESLSLRSGINPPELYLTDDEAVNGLAIQQSGAAAAVITRGAADRLDRLQLEGLLAEIVARIANDDARRATVATGMLLPFTDGPASFLSGPAHAMIGRVLHPDRELSGDIEAVGLTRYPPGLRDVLTLADEGDANGSPSTARLWVFPPANHESRYNLEIRLAALNEF